MLKLEGLESAKVFDFEGLQHGVLLGQKNRVLISGQAIALNLTYKKRSLLTKGRSPDNHGEKLGA